MTTVNTSISNAPRPPQAKGLPLVGSARDFLSRPMEFFLEQYEAVGPIFRMRVFNRSYVVMAGLEANRFLAQHGGEYFTSYPLFGEFAAEMGSSNFLVAIDGEPHAHMRKVMQRGYSKGGIAPHLDNFRDLAETHARSWPVGELIYVRDRAQRLVTEQLGLALTNHSAAPNFEAIRTYLNTLLSVFVIKRWPKFMLYTPRYRRAKAEVMAMSAGVIADHRQGNGAHEPDLIDDLLAAVDWNGNPLKDDDILAATIGPFFAGMDTVANTMGFMLYAVLRHPDVLERITAEVDGHFAGGVPPWRELPQLQALYGATIETLRRYPVAPFTPRGVLRPFAFAGHRVEAGEEVIIVNGLTHFLPEYFPDPWRFDIERYTPERKEHRQGLGIFAPYTLGPHTCLGAGAAEVQLMVTMGALLRVVELELPAPDYELKTVLMPIPGPDPKFQARVVGLRN